MKIFPLGNSAISIEFNQEISISQNEMIVALAGYLSANRCAGFIECIPAYASLTVFYELSPEIRFYQMLTWLETEMAAFKKITLKNAEQQQSIIEIPTIYDGEDLQVVAEHCQLTINEVIEIHTAVSYRVFMLGFLPGFAYLGGLDARIATPRRATPRQAVPPGSVGIAGMQTGIYPTASPGGWQLIGRTEKKLFSRSEEPPSLLKAGDLVKFTVI